MKKERKKYEQKYLSRIQQPKTKKNVGSDTNRKYEHQISYTNRKYQNQVNKSKKQNERQYEQKYQNAKRINKTRR